MELQILLVDDNPVQAAARSAILSRAGHSVLLAESAASALLMFQEPGFRTSLGLMVTDHLMPGMNGPELVRKVRSDMPELPVLVLSGLPDAEFEYPEGEVVFRLKPFPPHELIRLAKHMLGARGRRSA